MNLGLAITTLYLKGAEIIHLAKTPPPSEGNNYQPLNPDPKAPAGLEHSFSTFLSWFKWGGYTLAVMGVIACGIMMIVGRRHRSQLAVDGASGVIWVLAGVTLIALSAGLVGTVLEVAS